MRKVLISVLAGVTLMCVAWAATPAEAVISPSPLDCSIENGGCTPLSGVGSLIFGQAGPDTLTVAYQMDGFKIVGGDQFALNLTGVSPGDVVDVTGTGITGTFAAVIGSFQVDGCPGCFNFEVGPSVIDPSLPVGTAYLFMLSAPGLSPDSVVPGGPLLLDAMLHLNIGGGPNGTDSVFAAETGAVPEPGTLSLIGAGLIGVGTWARRKSRNLFRK